MILMLLILLPNYPLIHGLPMQDDQSWWWNAITNHLVLWPTEEGFLEDNEEEIENSVKLMELFPTLKEQLQSPDEKEQKEAKEFIKKMSLQIKEKKRYTSILWKGVKTIIDMGRVESNERRSNEENVGILWRFIQGFVNLLKRIFGWKNDNDNDNDSLAESAKKKKNHKQDANKHESNHDHNEGVKDTLDHFDEKSEEFIDKNKSSRIHHVTENKSSHSDHRDGIKGTLDHFDESKSVEFLGDKENSASKEIRKEKE